MLSGRHQTDSSVSPEPQAYIAIQMHEEPPAPADVPYQLPTGLCMSRVMGISIFGIV